MIRLIACSHGTRFADGRRVIARIRRALASAVPEAEVLEAFVDVEEPAVAEVVARASAGEFADRPAVVVPLLLSTGFHTSVDIARAVEPWQHAIAAGPLGPHPRLVRALLDRLAEALEADTADQGGGTGAARDAGVVGLREGDHVVLAAAGSSDPAAARAVEAMRDHLAAHLPCPVIIGYGAGASPSIPQAVSAARDDGASRVIAASYVLAPGHFARLVTASGADLVSAPLGDHPAVIEVAAQRFRGALQDRDRPGPDGSRRCHGELSGISSGR